MKVIVNEPYSVKVDQDLRDLVDTVSKVVDDFASMKLPEERMEHIIDGIVLSKIIKDRIQRGAYHGMEA